MPAANSGSPLTAEQRAEVLDLAAVVVAVVLLAFVLSGQSGVLRLLLTVLFTFFVPGRAFVSNWPRMAAWADLAMCIAMSLGLLVAFALITLWLRDWRPEALFVAEALLSLAGLAAGIYRRRRLGTDWREPEAERREPEAMPRAPGLEPRGPEPLRPAPGMERREPEMLPAGPGPEPRGMEPARRVPETEPRGPEPGHRGPWVDPRGPQPEPPRPQAAPRGSQANPRGPEGEPRTPPVKPRRPEPPPRKSLWD